MSCEGNRHRFLNSAAPLTGLNPAQMEKVYQAGKAGGAGGSDIEELTHKTRLLFDAMRGMGIKPPTHSKDGLPKPDSRAGYAALYDYLIANSSANKHNIQRDELIASPPDVKKSLPVSPEGLLDFLNKNAAGYIRHNRRPDGTLVPTLPPEFSLPFSMNTLEIVRYQAFLQRKDAQGFLSDGYDEKGFDRDGFDMLGYSIYGLSRTETNDNGVVHDLAAQKSYVRVVRNGLKNPKNYDIDAEGFSPDDGFRPAARDEKDDMDRFGYNRLGFRQGRSWTGYDQNGLDAQGNPAPKRKGYDAWGYHRKEGLTAPDDKGRRYNLIGWVYNEKTGYCHDPADPARRMKHEGSFKLRKVNGKMKVTLARSYIPDENALAERIKNPSIRLGEYRQGGGLLYRYAKLGNSRRRAALMAFNHPVLRYLRSEERLKDNPDADFLGVRLRCPKCGQFTGARPHQCPHYGEKVAVFSSGFVIAYRRGVYRPKQRKGPAPYTVANLDGMYSIEYTDVLEGFVSRSHNVSSDHYSSDHPFSTFFDQVDIASEEAEFPGFATIPVQRIAAHLLLQPNESAVLLENPIVPDFDPEFEGGVLCGFHWKSGLSREGFTPLGFHFLTGRSRDGRSIREIVSATRIQRQIAEAAEALSQAGKGVKEMLEATYSRIASAIAGAPRRVRVTEQGGPRPGMFWTDMRGRIQAERFPLRDTPNDSDVNNLLAMKAGIYHELGHEEDTPVGVFARILDIANGREQVDGIPHAAAGLVAEVYNILEDGRMERQQAKRRRGVAAILAADARINPRWDEKVGDDLPPAHQVMGLMLYRSLPFFRVRPEVLEQAPPRVRRLYDEVRPLVDRAMRSPEDAFQAAIEITRRLVRDDELREFSKRMTREGTQGGRWVKSDGEGSSVVVISALPKPGSGAQADKSIPVPPQGWGAQDEEPTGKGRQAGQAEDEEPTGRGRRAGQAKDEEPTGQGRQAGQAKDEEPTGQGRQAGQAKDEEPTGQGRRAGQAEDEEPTGQGRRAGQAEDEEPTGQGRQAGQAEDEEPTGQGRQAGQAAGASGGVSYLSPTEPDQEFFDSVAGETDMLSILDDLNADVRRGANAILRSPVGRTLSRPMSAIETLVVDDPDDPDKSYSIIIPKPPNDADPAYTGALREKARPEGRKAARRLETLREQIRRKAGLQTSGKVDRKRFKRAVGGAKSVYARTRLQDITSLAVSIQLDMSGSMDARILSGQLAGATLALEEALNRLDAEYMVSGFGTEYALFKSFGDEKISDGQLANMTRTILGGTRAAPGMRLGLLGLKERRSANKLHIMMTDGALYDSDRSAAQAEEMRRNGIVPFGIFFGSERDVKHVRSSMDSVFGAGNWVRIEHLSDMSGVVARRIEQIYRRILATR